MNSRERMLTAIGCGKPDHVPLSFMIFSALRARSGGWQDFVDRSVELGIDPVVSLSGAAPSDGAEHSDAPGTPVHYAPGVKIREWRETSPDQRYPVLHKEYVTPAGTLSVAVNRTDDWPYGDHVPFLNDYIEPRAVKHLVTSPDDLPALRHLLAEPTDDDLRDYRAAWKEAKGFAAEKGVLLAAGWGVGADALAWIFGLTNAVMTAVDDPDFLDELLDVISDWNRRRMEVILDVGVDLFVRRGWYEGTSFWSPGLFGRFLLPRLQAEAELAHQAGAKFGYIMTVGANQFTDALLASGVDVVIGVEDVQDHGMDLAALKEKAHGKLALWGGVNGFLHIEEGTEDDIRKATAAALDALGPDGFILSPVDNIRDPSEAVWKKVLTFVDTWKETVGR
ncbi:MAG TPA: uroporphyrinogen decarboxylase family protein [Planctomycetota bacterium]|nr:uroporphyrinogen decarboxylase family protein [Planctomycetota bacterium]